MVIKYPDYPPPNGSPATRDLSVVTVEIIHHSAGPITQTPLDIDAFHRQPPDDFVMIGYNLLIGHDGTVYQGRPMTDVPAATEGFNTESVAICLIGNFQPDDAGYTGPPSAAQMQSLKDLSVYVPHKIPTIDSTKGHRDFMSDACPGDELYNQIPAVRAYTLAHLQH